MATDLVYNGEIIHLRSEKISLTDMWRANGSDPNRSPPQWLADKQAQKFIAALAEKLNMVIDHVELIHTVRGGKNPGTWAHWQIALAYAQYLAPAFHIWCNEVVRDRVAEKQRLKSLPGVDGRIQGMLGGAIKRTNQIGRETHELSIIVQQMARSQHDMQELLVVNQRKSLEYIRDRMRNLESNIKGRPINPIPELVTAKEVATRMAGVPSEQCRPSFSRWVSNLLKEACGVSGAKFGPPYPGARTMFERVFAASWLDGGGRQTILARFKATAPAQGNLRLVQPKVASNPGADKTTKENGS